ncbi:MAG TPA: prolyl oligopeptidase family serine peptidase [Ardenticatenaceae bacterium]|jgi:dipeptidyl aminopeptidase/acylaminoacyl peptidase
MTDRALTLDQLLSISGIGAGAYGGGDVIRWSPDGGSLLVHASLGGGSELWQVARAGGFPRRVTNGMSALPFLASPQQSYSPGGRWIAYLGEVEGATEVWLWDREDGQQRPLTRLGNNISSYSWAPDGQSLAVASNRRGTYDIYCVAVPSGQATRLTRDERYEVSPVVTLDGSRVLYVRLDERWTDHEIVSIAPDGSDARVIATDEDFFDYHYGRTFGLPLVSPDSQQVLFRSHRSGWINYWRVPVTGGEPQSLCPQECDQSGAAWSPDGRQVAFISNTNGTLSLWLCNADGSGLRPLVQPETGVCQAPTWSPDGRTIAYLFSSTTDPQDLWTVEVETGERRQLTTSTPAGAVRGLLNVPQKVCYPSFDGLPIHAYLYAPTRREPGRRYPGVILAHGGPTMQFFDAYDPLAQFLSSQGYAVLMPNVRGSSGYGREFEKLNDGDWGHADLQDTIAGTDFLRIFEWIDPDQMGITGTSYGGVLSMAAVCNAPGAFQAAAPHAGYADWIHAYYEQEKRHLQLLRYEFGDIETHEEVYRHCSPIFNAARAGTPVLVLQGEGQLPRSDASYHFVDALRKEYKAVEHRVYREECYYVRTRPNVRQMFLDLLAFFDRHLKG